jgi:hypothetical protein
MPQITIQDYSILNCFIFELRAATFLPLGLEHKKKEKNIICYFVLLKKKKNRIPTILPIYLGSWVQKKMMHLKNFSV